MARIEAESILKDRRYSRHILTPGFAIKINQVGGRLPGETTLNDLYNATHTYPNEGAGKEWYELLLGLTRTEKSSLTRALIGVSVKEGLEGNLTLSELREMEVKQLVGWRTGEITASFLVLAFARSEV